MIGDSTFYTQHIAVGPTATVDLTPFGDVTGRFWGAFLARASEINPACTVYTTVEVGGVVQFSHRWINRNRFLCQLFQYGVWQTTFVYDDWVFVPSLTEGTGSPGSGTRIGSVAGTIISGTGFGRKLIDPKRSYQNPYFQPANMGPSSSALAYTPGSVAAEPAESFWLSAEPVYFWINRNPGESVIVRSALYKEVPISSLSNPINDDPPTGGSTLEPDEISVATTVSVDGWMVRYGGGSGVETVVPINTRDPAEPEPA